MTDVEKAGETGMGEATLVSVVIPCYDQSDLVAEAIESALGQTHARVEVVVVDDGSPDKIVEVAARYPTICFVRQENQGLSAARNSGLRRSHGEYVLFLDADDRLTPTAVEAHLRCFAEHPDARFVVGEIYHLALDGSYSGSPRWREGEDHYEELLKANHVANTIAVMFRRSVFDSIGEFGTACSAGADYDILLRAARVFPSAHHSTVVAGYRRHGNNMSRNGVLMLQTMLGIMGSQQRYVRGDARLEAASREGENYWRDHYGAVTARDAVTHIAKGQGFRAAQAIAVLIRHVRGRLLLLPWKYRRNIVRAVRRMLGAKR